MIQDIWRLTSKKCKHRLMETKLSANIDVFLLRTVSLAVQLLSPSVVVKLKKYHNPS